MGYDDVKIEGNEGRVEQAWANAFSNIAPVDATESIFGVVFLPYP